MPNSFKHNFRINRPWVYHTLFWLAYYFFGVLISLSIHRIYDGRFYAELLSLLPPDMILVYLNLYVLIPSLLLKRQFVGYFMLLAVTATLIAISTIFFHRLYAQAGSSIFASVSEFNLRNFSVQLLNNIYLLGLTTALKFLKDWMSQRQELQEKEQERIATELDFLKSQIHPHFFFNTLNNLYSLTLQKSDTAPEVVLKLSDLMSYMLYESGASLVPLGKEISNLENYIALEQLRFGNRLSLSFLKEDLFPTSIPPLILLAFVENGFKHGMNQTVGNGRIAISLRCSLGQLLFYMENPLPPSTESMANRAGIGLKNVVRRLDLLYSDRYSLTLSQEANVFRVTLKLPLS